MLSIDKFSESHLRFIVGRIGVLFALITLARRWATKLFDFLFTTQRTFYWANITSLESWFISWAFRTTNNTASSTASYLYILNYTACNLFISWLISCRLHSWFLYTLNFFFSWLNLSLRAFKFCFKSSQFFSKIFDLNKRVLIFNLEFLNLSLINFNFLLNLYVFIDNLSFLR